MTSVCRVFVSEHGNVFMREIAEHLVEALVLTGRSGELVIDDLPDGGDDPMQNLVVAPHEFFVLSPASEADRLRAAAASVCINTEQPGTPFFDLAMTYAARGPVVLDINPSRSTPSADWALPRCTCRSGHAVDGRMARRRSSAHGRHRLPGRSHAAARAVHRRRRRDAVGVAAPICASSAGTGRSSASGPAFATGDAKFAALADTRILLNVHRSDEPYFEWARVVEAIANGCVVATETRSGSSRSCRASTS